MAGINIGNTPVNQLNALPLVTAQSVGDPGEIVVVGNTIIKYWSPVALFGSGIGNAGFAGNVADPFQPGARSGIVTNFIDVRGCNYFAFTMTLQHNNVAGDIGSPGWAIAIQHMGVGLNGIAVTPGGGINSDAAFPSPFNLSAGAKLVGAVNGSYRTGEGHFYAASAGHRMMGTLRLYIHQEGQVSDPVNQLWWLSMWGQG
jgi:hypothetical protein